MMRLITVNAHETAFIYRNGALNRILNQGSYWLGFKEQYQLYDRTVPFVRNRPLHQLIAHPDFQRELDLIKVQENELVLVFSEGLFLEVLGPGFHLFWKSPIQFDFLRTNTTDLKIDIAIDRTLLNLPSLQTFVRKDIIEDWEQGLLFQNGTFIEVLKPGLYYHWKHNNVIQVYKADMRRLTMEISGQEMLSKDKAQIRLNFNIQYRITDVLKTFRENKEHEKQLYLLIQLALRDFVGRISLDELMDSRDQLAVDIMKLVSEHVAALGIELLYCGVKDIILPGDIKTILSQVLIAEKRAQANAIRRREETASTRSLLNTAKLMEDNNMLFRLHEMEYLEKIAEKISSISISGGGQLLDQMKQIFSKT